MSHGKINIYMKNDECSNFYTFLIIVLTRNRNRRNNFVYDKATFFTELLTPSGLFSLTKIKIMTVDIRYIIDQYLIYLAYPIVSSAKLK